METIRAITNMARHTAEGRDGDRTPGGTALLRKAETMNKAAEIAIVVLGHNGLNPDEDKATQFRLAAAVDRQIVGAAADRQAEPGAVAKHIMHDFYMQEAAARRLVHRSEHDPLAHLANERSARGNDEAIAILGRQKIDPAKLLKTASIDDISAIAAGRYDQIKSDHTRFGISTVLNLSEDQMRAPTSRVPEAKADEPNRQPFRAPDLVIGRPVAPTASFGRKVSAQR